MERAYYDLPHWDLQPTAEAIFLYLGVRLADESVRAIVRQAIERDAAHEARAARGVYGPDGDVLSRFDIPAEDADEG